MGFKPHGVGKEYCKDGSKYEGEFKEGNREGKGTETFPNGAKY